MEECIVDSSAVSPAGKGNSVSEKAKPVPLESISAQDTSRFTTGIEEFDRVLGGGATKRSAVMIGGEPGIGKSTLLIQAASKMAQNFPGKILYISGEESAAQIKDRADRLLLNCKGIEVLCTMRLEDILDSLDKINPVFVIIDSIQTVYSAEAGLVPGTVNQLKYCANELVGWVKNRDSVLIMTAHITKEGTIAGPKTLEHMVDTVISFERNSDDVRFLHAQKNRFGSVDELGIFEMTAKGLVAVTDPSTMFITRREGAIPAGVSVSAVFEGTRVFLVEIQALTVPAKSTMTRVYSEKIDSARVSRVAAVLEKQTGLRFSDHDIYVNVAGGIRLTESAIDAALAASLYSARSGVALSGNSVVIGELSLAGEIRPVGRIKQRAKTAASLGYTTIVAPEKEDGVIAVKDVHELIKKTFK